MTENENTTAAAPEAEKVVYEKGTWQAALQRAGILFDKSTGERKRASTLLWQGATAAISDWEEKSDVDVHAEVLYADILDILGTPRKGDASKIKTVALAVKQHGLVTSTYPNLSKAYAEAVRLTKTVAQDKADDTAADEAIAEVAANAPKSSSTPEGAALIVLAKGLDEAARLLLDALNTTAAPNNVAAHRALLRAVSQEIAGRVPKPAPKPPKAASDKKKATPAKKTAVKKAATTKTAATKAKPISVKKATPVKPKPGTEASPEPEGGDMFDDILGDDPAVETVETPVAPVAKKAKPVAVKRV